MPALVQGPAPSATQPSTINYQPSTVQWLRGTLDNAPWDDITAFSPEVCLHMAWITTPGIYLESPENERFRDASLSFIRKLCEIGGRGGEGGRGGQRTQPSTINPAAPYIFALGTCVEYQPSDQPLSEDRSPIAPSTLYARCKNDLRIALASEAKSRGFGFAWGRVFYPYGPGEHPSRLCSSIIHKLAQNEKILLKTPDSTKDYIYIDDLAAALLTVIEKKFNGIINLGTGIGVSVKQIAETIAQKMSKPGLVESASHPDPDPWPHVLADPTKLKSLGWTPQWTMAKGLDQMVKLRG